MIKSHPLQAHVENGRREIFVDCTDLDTLQQHNMVLAHLVPPICWVQSTIKTSLQVLHTNGGVPERSSS